MAPLFRKYGASKVVDLSLDAHNPTYWVTIVGMWLLKSLFLQACLDVIDNFDSPNFYALKKGSVYFVLSWMIVTPHTALSGQVEHPLRQVQSQIDSVHVPALAQGGQEKCTAHSVWSIAASQQFSLTAASD